MLYKSVVTCFLLLFVRDARSWNLTISPEHTQIKPGGCVTILCQTDVPLTACTFQVGNQGPYNLADGAGTSIITEQDGENGRVLYTARYSGMGLDKGHCGITLDHMTGDGENYYLGCRVKAATGGWRYKYASVVVHAWDTFPLKISPAHAVVTAGKSVSFLCQSEQPLRMCRFELPAFQDAIYFDQGPHSPRSHRYQYHGHDLRRGHCGVTLHQVTDADNGILWCGADTLVTNVAVRSASLTVAKAPSEAELLISKLRYAPGEKLTATCTVRDARPVATITWFLGDKMVRHDADDDAPTDEWKWPWDLRTLTQRLTRIVSLEDDGKELKCVAEHLTLMRSMQSKQKIRVHPATNGSTKHPSSSSTTSPPVRAQTNPSTSSSTTPVRSSTPSPAVSLSSSSVAPQPTTPSALATSPVAIPTDANCGRRSASTLIGQKISNGEDASLGDYPWTAAIYRRLLNGTYFLQCSGTLITSQLVVSVSHCFWDETFARKSNATFRVVLGKLSRDWEINDETEQRFNTSEIIVHPRFRGRRRNYEHDIAVVRLATRANITDAVNVACLDWTDKYADVQMSPGVNGTVTGWGYTEDGVISDVLQYVNLPYVDAIQCYDSLSEDIQPLVTNDKFCAGFVGRNVSVCPGDSGGGLVFHEPIENRYYLRGAVSLGFRPAGFEGLCFSQQVSGFTIVSAYLKWLLQYRVMYS